MSVRRVFLTLLVCGWCASQLMAAPVWMGREGTQYATVDNPFEIEFDADGYLYAGHDVNANVQIYRIPPGGGAAAPWGTMSPYDPDGLSVAGDFVYAAGEYDVYRTHRSTGVTQRWTNYSTSRNMTTMVVDQAGDYGNPGDIFIGSARHVVDVEQIDVVTRVATTLVNSADLYIPRGLVFARGSLYCLESDASLGLWQIGSAGQLTRVDDGGFDWGMPHALAYHAGEDAFYVGDLDLGQVMRIPRAGGNAEVVAWDFDYIAAITFDPAGNMYVSDSQNDVIWQMPVPEPSSIALLGAGAVGLLLLAWRRRGHPRPLVVCNTSADG